MHVPAVRVDGHQPAPLAAHADGGDLRRTRADAVRADGGSPPRSLATSHPGPARRRRRAGGAGRPSPSRGRRAPRRCSRGRPAGPPVPRSTPRTKPLTRYASPVRGTLVVAVRPRRATAAGFATITPGSGEEGERAEREVGVADDDLDDEHQDGTAEVAGEQQEPGRGGGPLRAGLELGPVQGDGQARQQEEADDREGGRDQPQGRAATATSGKATTASTVVASSTVRRRSRRAARSGSTAVPTSPAMVVVAMMVPPAPGMPRSARGSGRARSPAR